MVEVIHYLNTLRLLTLNITTCLIEGEGNPLPTTPTQ